MGGEASDYSAVPDLLGMPVGKPRLSLADKGYDGDFLRVELLIHGLRPVIPPKANQKNPPACDFRASFGDTGLLRPKNSEFRDIV
ncbi:hypothetical protein KX729_30585 [Rhizobium sp. XQZ8]|uniref:hypothetical protein n=1 Tax=Rhizobium populisoli TaxID=2859785 RepID=UPI001CA497B7|nr:hypothetical protein [Rhizobium populisoli]MBW6425742.1 hypothetical protein [Rhizobium populisoli]